MTTDNNKNVDLIKKFQQLLASGKPDEALQLIDKNAVWHSDEVGAPWSGVHQGIEAITKHFGAISGTTQQFKRSDQSFVTKDDLVIELGSLSCILNKTNNPFATEYVCLYTAIDGRIMSYRIFEDSLKLYKAYFNE